MKVLSTMQVGGHRKLVIPARTRLRRPRLGRSGWNGFDPSWGHLGVSGRATEHPESVSRDETGGHVLPLGSTVTAVGGEAHTCAVCVEELGAGP